MPYMFVKLKDGISDKDMTMLEEELRIYSNVEKIWFGASPTSGFTKNGS